MKVLVVGSGGREHAVCKALKKSPEVSEILCAPGNGGTAQIAENVPVSATDLQGMLELCRDRRPDLVFVTPDDPLAMGMVDLLEENGFACFGPCRAAARIEASKVWSKAFMKKYDIPTAGAEVFTDRKSAEEGIKTLPVVLKADGLAAGKGVLICKSSEELEDAFKQLFEDKKFGAACDRVLAEEFLEGPEVSVLCFCDGEHIVPMPASQDHKRLLEGDLGPNTGGMGAITPVSCYTEEIAKRCMEEIFLPTVRGMQQEGCPFKGVLYFSLMLTADGPRVIEYNARLGDPETQCVLPLLKSDIIPILLACREGGLDKVEVEFEKRASCCVVMACANYPQGSTKGLEITGIEEGMEVFHAGTAVKNGKLYTNGGRVLAVGGKGETLREALDEAYAGVSKIHFCGARYRRDIGFREGI